MVPITVDNLSNIDMELTSWCNADCPMCARTAWDGKPDLELINKAHLKLEVLDRNVGTKVFGQLKTIDMCGILGDAIMNPECLDIVQYLSNANPSCQITLMTNGGVRNKEFWNALGKIPNLLIMFGIDGLKDTNHLYRRNVQWDKLIENARTYIEAGGRAIWQFIVFKHNEHELDTAEALSKTLGFESFTKIYTARWQARNWTDFDSIKSTHAWPVDNGRYFLEPPISQPVSNVSFDNPKFNLNQKIKCRAASDGMFQLLFRADGTVQPCCMLGELSRHQMKDLLDDPRDININYNSLESILNSSFYQRLYNGIQGGEERLQSCFFHCGLQEQHNRYIE